MGLPMAALSRLHALQGYLMVCEEVSRKEGQLQAAARFETALSETRRIEQALFDDVEEVPPACTCPLQSPFLGPHHELSCPANPRSVRREPL